jgi:predicted MFS family arabinose efflux permease
MRATDARFIAGGAVALAVAMGVGRFAYTPLLPVMEHDAGLGVSMAGALASANLFGYLVGASLAMHPITHGKRLAIVRWSLAGVVVTTALMATIAPLWLPLRFVTGVCSGFVLVFASSIVLERAAHARAPSWPPLFFSGVGLGIAFSGVAVPALVAYGGSRAAWVGIAAVSGIALLVSARWFTDGAPGASLAGAGIDAPLPRRSTFAWLLTVYTAEAFAYIIPATFLVARPCRCIRYPSDRHCRTRVFPKRGCGDFFGYRAGWNVHSDHPVRRGAGTRYLPAQNQRRRGPPNRVLQPRPNRWSDSRDATGSALSLL